VLGDVLRVEQHGHGDSSPDGASWELHFELTYTKLSSAVVGRIDA